MSLQKKFDKKFFFTPIFCCCFWIRDSGSGIRDKHPGSATLIFRNVIRAKNGIDGKMMGFGKPENNWIWENNEMWENNEIWTNNGILENNWMWENNGIWAVLRIQDPGPF